MSYERGSQDRSSGSKDAKKKEGIEQMRPHLREAGLKMYDGPEGLEWEIRVRGVELVEQTIEIELEEKDQHAAKRADAYHAEREYDYVMEFRRAAGKVCDGHGGGGINYLKVCLFQEEHGLHVDGLIGPKTIDAAEKRAPAGGAAVKQRAHAEHPTREAAHHEPVAARAEPVHPHRETGAHPAAAAPKETGATAGATAPPTAIKPAAPAAAPSGGGVSAAVASIQIVAKTDTAMLLNPAKIFELVPWNTQQKAEAFRPVQAAVKKLRAAHSLVVSTSDPKHKEKALHQVDAATHQLEAAALALKKYVLSQLPRIERNDEEMKRIHQVESEREAQLKTLNKQGNSTGAEHDEAAHGLAAAKEREHAREHEIVEQIESNDYGLSEVTRVHYTVIIDGEQISLQDHIEAYATTVAAGLDGKASSEVRGKGESTVDEVLAKSPFSESIKKILKTISASEGGFSTVNTYDKAVLTWGMMQWTGGNKSDLVHALRVIKRVSPEAFQQRFAKYGIDVRGEDLIVAGDQGVATGQAAATAVQGSPALTGVFARAGMDSKIQLGELEAAVESKIDGPLGATLELGKGQSVRVGDVFTSEFAVGVLADATVHGGFPKKALTDALHEFVHQHGLAAVDVHSWGPKAEAALIPVVVAGWTKRAAELEKNGCSRAPGSFKR